MMLMKAAWIIILAVLYPLLVDAEEIQKFSFSPPQDMTVADVYALKITWNPRAVLVLCPGQNGNGERMIQQKEWQEFACQQHIALAGICFASKDELLYNNQGYFYASQGSGHVFVDAIRKIYGSDLPILLYGFSGGAMFVSRFVEWRPERVLSWCAYSGGWWDAPEKAAINPPGIVACGDADPRYGATMIYFKQGRAANKPWLWISLPKVGHDIHRPFEDFVREYFAEILDKPSSKGLQEGLWIDVDLKVPAAESLVKEQPSLTGWLPDDLFEKWKAIHEP